MISRYLRTWKWLWFFAVGLMLFGVFGPLPDPSSRILSGVGAVLSLVYIGAITWEERRQRQKDQSSSTAIPSCDQM
jgi:hypothetical protein